ncbi:uncharacterized protein PG986_000193 [Apiospora aurea]|uniref:F-box domain-containing protein n=1 Tax=Apiospora aurea TaxID=335848 RepID=A0ABR1QTB0_9PEZI
MASPDDYTPRMSRIEGLPDELILGILSRLSFASFYCVAQSSRRLRAICRDRTYRLFRIAREALRQNTVSGHGWHAILQSNHQKDTLRFSPVMLAVALRLPTLWRLLPLIRKDLFCGECLEFRRQPQFVQNAKWLLTKVNYCMGCKEYHGAMLFPRDPVTWAPRDRCLAHTGSVRLCPHQKRDWAEIVRGHSEWLQEPTPMHNRPFFRCTECEVPSNSAGAAIFYDMGGSYFSYARLLPDSPDLRKGHILGEDYLSAVRTFCMTAEYQYICPHLRLDNPYLLFRLSRAISGLWTRRTSGEPQQVQTNRELREVSGYLFQCRSCHCVINLRRVRVESTGPGKLGKFRLALKTWQRVPVADTPGARHLAKLDPLSYGDVDVWGPRSRCISWCESADCGTNRLGRREAKVLEAAW